MNQNKPPAIPPVSGKGTGEIPTVVVVDDEPAVRVALQKRLERSGYHVITAGDYHDFVNIMTDCDAVLCDIILPGNSGLEVLSWCRENYPSIPVVMITGEPTYETAAQAIRLGAYDYLAKPIHKGDLLTTLSRAVEHHRLILDKQRLEAENEVYQVELERRVAQRTKALRESQEFLSSLADTMADAVLSLKMPEGEIEYINRAVTKIFGYQPEELLGQTTAILYPDETSFDVFNRRQTIATDAGQSQMRMEYLLRHKDGKLIWTEIATNFIRSEGQVIRSINVVRDITERSLLLGVVAHELRGPLSLLTGFSEALRDDVDGLDHESMSNYLHTMHRTATRMLKILDELLDVAEIDLGKVYLNIEPVDLSDILRMQSQDYFYIARKKNIKFDLHLPSEPLACPGDPVKIAQVISNFIDNAIKYSPTASVVEITGARRGSELWVGVKDQGPGIKPDEVRFLFKSFGHSKISSKPTSGEKSTGLGLAICKRIIDAHHGKIGVETSPGQGSTFWFTLPSPHSQPNGDRT